jgi:hypothetical protein
MLEEAIDGAGFPIYGLPPGKIVCGLRYSDDSDYVQKLGETVALSYESRIYRPFVHVEIHEPTLRVISSSWEHLEGLHMRPLTSWSPFIPAIHFPEVPRVGTSERISLSIDGVKFTGGLSYWVRPLFYTSFEFISTCLSIPKECERHCVRLCGNAYGPSIDEVFEILQELRMLNRKQME